MSVPAARRVLVVDDHPVVRLGLARMVAAHAELALAGAAADGAEAVALYRAQRPDVVLMDLRMPGHDGVWAIATIRAEDPAARIVILTTFDGDEDIYRGMKAGAMAYLLKDCASDELLGCIRAVTRGEHYLPAALAARLARHGEAGALTRRETEVLQLMATGRSNKEIARETGITEGTVKFHVTSVMAKLGARTRTEAVAVALRRGLVAFG